MEEALSRMSTSLFYFSDGVRHGAQDLGSQVYTLRRMSYASTRRTMNPYQSRIRGSGGFCAGQESTNEVRASRRESQCNQQYAQCPVGTRETIKRT